MAARAPAVIYGIRNCDTMKKARAWLDARAATYTFHDYKVEGVARETLEAWADKTSWQTLLNRAGTTFRALPDEDKQGLDRAKAIALMLRQPAMIKRPVLIIGDAILIGFKPDLYDKAFA